MVALIKILDLKFSSHSDSIQRSFFHYEPMEAMEHVPAATRMILLKCKNIMTDKKPE